MLRFRGFSVLFVFTVVFAFLQPTFALPALFRRQPEHGFDFSKYTVPLSEGTSTLPGPNPTLTLKAITLARGHQNYTCPPPSSTSTPPTLIGALATLYDATPLLALLSSVSTPPPAQPPSPSQPLLNFLTRYLYHFAFPNFLTHYHRQHDVKDHDRDRDGDGDGDDDKGKGEGEGKRKRKEEKGSFGIPVLGHHFFDGAHVPTWDMGPELGVLKGKKVGGFKSLQVGSVDWLVLGSGDGGGGGSDGGTGGGGEGGEGEKKKGVLKEVYRVETVGGGVVGGECVGRGEGDVVRVRYAAQYWFYG